MEPKADTEEDFNKTFIEDASILDKYKAASDVADRALAFVIELCKPGEDIATICSKGDEFIEAEVNSANRRLRKYTILRRLKSSKEESRFPLASMSITCVFISRL